MNRKTLTILMCAALLSLAADEGGAPWRGQRLYGFDITTKEYRVAHRAEMARERTYEGQVKVWRNHVQAMKDRVWDRGLDIVPAPEVVPAGGGGYRRPVFASYLMTGEEVEDYRARERAITSQEASEEAHEAFLRDHENAMKQRAWDRGLPIDETPSERKERKRQEAIAAKRKWK